ncbi:LOW QUALITY PROTEIN: hypothetical protein QC761_0101710 [Podospora bellae-mahoneyi]|uniref:Uncharacterized protein n=1 Tax=Podospora bellae-mahoneyi TaxID=2093777 RepID=A0ABR0F6Y0_9PEZI|nr:LOW QUALITY PROTEIN: hypothetical protein QC761_0101710 [Podospora bellae-mahoneyi]
MEQFGKVIEVFVNSNGILAFVWGPLKLSLLTAKGGADPFDCLLDAYSTIEKILPIFKNYQHIFGQILQFNRCCPRYGNQFLICTEELYAYLQSRDTHRISMVASNPPGQVM